jgi:DNA end-binding protein Ku
MKAIWTGSIGFGLVNIPVKILSAVQNSELDLDMLDKKDKSNIQFKRVNANTGKEVDWKNIVKGYKIDDHYVVLSKEDFERASPEQTKTITISSFVNEKEIDSIYYLQPDKSGTRPYALLCEALKKTGKAGLGTFIMRNRESLVIIKPSGNLLLLNTIRFQQEIRDASEVKIPTTKTSPEEVKMAVQLITQLSTEFDISDLKDTYTEKLLKLIKAKSKGGKIPAAGPKLVSPASDDLMKQLKESLSAGKRKAS